MREILFLILFFFAVSLFSIYLGILTKEAIKKGEIQPVFENPSDFKNSLYMLFLILFGTLLMFIFIKVRFELVKILENLALFLLIASTFSYFLPAIPSFLLSFAIVSLSEIKPSFILKNACIFLAIPSAAAIIGASLDYKVLLLFFFLLAIYDIISVFVTKHMVYLAEKLTSRPSALISIFPSKKVRNVKFSTGKKRISIIALGAGDYFMPASFSVSLISLGIKYSIVVSIFNSLTLFILFSLLTKREISRPLPAIPFLFISSLIAFIFSFYL
jgi:presenilin-like A22 family membrane protease